MLAAVVLIRADRDVIPKRYRDMGAAYEMFD